MRRFTKTLLSGMIIGSLSLQIGCQRSFTRRAPDQTQIVKIISDAEFVRTRRGEYVDGYLVEYESQYLKQWMFMALDIQRYVRDERLKVTGRLTEDFVKMSFKDQIDAEVPVFQVYRAAPNIPSSPNIPVLK
ncbi:MAG: hypothetical protein WCC00_04060 [Candidatus Aminicenantales bacterium]